MAYRQIGIHIHYRWKVLLLVLFTWFLVHSAFVINRGLHDFPGTADVAIILGNTVFADSSLSPVLQARVDKALELYRAGRVKEIFASGGKGEYGVGEGDAMKRYLVLHGVAAGSVVADNNGLNTYYTAKNFNTLNSVRHYRSAIAVSSFYHLTRTRYIIRKLGFLPVETVSSGAWFWPDGFNLFREFVAYYKYVLFY